MMYSKFDGDKCHHISDLHINHKNIVRGESNWPEKKGTRNFETRTQMNEAIFKSINDNVPEDHHLFVGGDIFMGTRAEFASHRSRIKCKNLHLIYGNHDEKIRENKEYQDLFSSTHDYLEIKVSDRSGKYRLAVLFHYPMKSWNGSGDSVGGSIAITGHVHGNLPYEDYERGIDVGWENFERPLTFHEICDLMDKKVWKPVDHHV
jgi:calcineurin-like phosphoesterase family protein